MQRPLVIRYTDDEDPSGDGELRKLMGVVTRFSSPGRRRFPRRKERKAGRPFESILYI